MNKCFCDWCKVEIKDRGTILYVKVSTMAVVTGVGSCDEVCQECIKKITVYINGELKK